MAVWDRGVFEEDGSRGILGAAWRGALWDGYKGAEWCAANGDLGADIRGRVVRGGQATRGDMLRTGKRAECREWAKA